MKITRENYEAYFIDYLEGNLEERLVNNFIEFLAQNPDLKEELSLFENIEAKPENVSFDKKENLYKQKLDSESEFEKAAVASLEGDITETEKTELDNYVFSRPEKRKELVLFSKTKLRADETIVFAKKDKLYRRSMGKVLFLWSGRIAAVLILAFAIFSIFNKGSEEFIPENKVAEVVEKTTKKEVKPKNKIIPVEPQKKEPEKTKKTTTKPDVKKIVPEKKTNKRLRENSQGRMKQDDLLVRIQVEVPNEMQSLTASINVKVLKASFVEMDYIVPANQNEFVEERLLADVVKEKTGLDKFKFRDIPRTGLKLIKGLSKDKFQYKVNEEGKVTDYKYESRLLAFTIATKNAEVEHHERSKTIADSE